MTPIATASPPLLVCRPEPGAAATVRHAAALGLTAVVAPLFAVEPLTWDPPDVTDFDAVVVTSANALRHAGPGLARYTSLRAFTVGPTTATAARAAGFDDVIAGDADSQELLTLIAQGECRRLLHLCGEHHRPLVMPGLHIRPVPVYRTTAATRLPRQAMEALTAHAVVVLHSPRAAALFADLTSVAAIDRTLIRLVAISPAAARAAGTGWRSVDAAPVPTDGAMLAIARELCKNPAR